MFRVGWWLVLAWAACAAVFAVLTHIGMPDTGGIYHELIFYGVPYAVIAAQVRHHHGGSWLELVPLRRIAPGLLVPVVLMTVGALVFSYQGVALCCALNVLPPQVFELARAGGSAVSVASNRSLTVALLQIAVIPAVFEEAMTRGLVLHTLAASMSRRRAIVISALLFAAMHGAIERMPGTFIGGLLYGWMYVRTGSLLPGMIAHALHNATIEILWRSGSLPGFSRSWFVVDHYGLLPAWLAWTALALSVGGALLIRKTSVWPEDPNWISPEGREESCDRAA